MVPSDVAAYFEAHRTRVYRWAFAMCGRHEDALDVVQEVFLRMLKRPPEPTGPSAVIAWLRQVTARLVIDRWRSESTRRSIQEQYIVPTGSQDDPESRELAENIRAAIESLSHRQRLVMMAKTYDRMTFAQIADELGIARPNSQNPLPAGADRRPSAARDRAAGWENVMNYESFEELLAGYIAGELDEKQTAELRAELESDPERRRPGTRVASRRRRARDECLDGRTGSRAG